ncbi:MAG TPA: GNAT family N-acetyltransferase, partial [Methanothrix sp.]|nr:GNAT family N-acetyltransferase [Methanothrix sp.]
GFYVWEVFRFGLKMLRNPPFTPQIGPFFEYRAINPAARTDEQRAVVEAMAEFLTSSDASVVSLGLSPAITDCLPFFWRGWKVIHHYTYRIDLSRSEGELMAAMSTERRKNIRKARNDGVSVREASDTHTMCSLMTKTFARQNMSIPVATVGTLFSEFSPGSNSYCLISQQEDGQPVAGAYIVHDAITAYYLIGGYATNGHHGAGALAMWHAILKAKAMGLKVFDFEGSMIPPIERYFRGFGGLLTPIFSIQRAWLPIEMILKILPKYRNRF